MKGEDGRRKGEIKTPDPHPSAQPSGNNLNAEIFFTQCFDLAHIGLYFAGRTSLSW